MKRKAGQLPSATLGRAKLLLSRALPGDAKLGGSLALPWATASRRRGVTLLEVCVALVVLAAAMTALAQLIAANGRQRRTNDQRLAALQEVANEAERLATLPWDELSQDKLTTWQPSQELAAVLPAAQCAVQMSDETGPPRARRITLSVAWTNAVGQGVAPVDLTFWRFAQEAAP